MLLQEIHHRVKNNLAIISGLLELQGYEVDEGVREAFHKSQIRIQSMSKVHEALYNSPSLSEVDLNDYLRELVDSVKQSHGFDEKNIELKYDIDPGMSMDINEAVPLALLISELITNAYKHAFEKGDEGVITVEAKREAQGSYVAVKDNGRGVDKDEFKNSQSLGSNIIRSLTQQLGAEMNINTDNGTRFELYL
jgi:two-component sensor histidine kinase